MMFSRTVSSMSSESSCGHDPEAAPDLDSVAGRVEPEDAQRPVRHRRDAPDHPHRRRLAGAVRAEEAERLAALKVEVDRVDRSELAEALDKPACLDQRFSVPTGHLPKATGRRRGAAPSWSSTLPTERELHPMRAR